MFDISFSKPQYYIDKNVTNGNYSEKKEGNGSKGLNYEERFRQKRIKIKMSKTKLLIYVIFLNS